MTEAVTTHFFISKTLPDKITKVYICKRKKNVQKERSVMFLVAMKIMMKFNVQELLHPFSFKIPYSNHCIAPIHAPLPRHLTQKSHIITCHFIHIHTDFSL